MNTNKPIGIEDLDNAPQHCPLCSNSSCYRYHEDRRRLYLQCNACSLVFVPKRFWLTKEQEKAEYDLHQNDIHDEGYRRFLDRLATPLADRLEKNACGLDFGSGPGPALATMLSERGFHMRCYDPYYAPNSDYLKQRFDFITATEVIEHLQHPNQVLSLLFKALKPNGWLGIMTKLVIDQDAFTRWHYKNDQTHICFYSPISFAWIAQHFQCRIEMIAKDVIFLQKIGTP